MSARRMPAPSRTAPRRCTWRCWRRGSGRATKSSPSATPSSPPPTASATAVRTPVFVDIEPRDLQHRSRHWSRRRSRRAPRPSCASTRSGCRATWPRSLPLARRHGIPLIEDAACAIGSEILWNGRWEKIGKPHGDVACFSFHPRKVITTGDGGMITTANAEWDARFRLLRQHGMSVPDTVRHGSREVIFESYPEVGFNYRMTDIQAAVGREQLKRLPEIVDRRRRDGGALHAAALADSRAGSARTSRPGRGPTGKAIRCALRGL